MVKTNPLGFRVDPDVKAALERAAKADDRSVSSMVERILRAWLIERGHLSAPAPQPAPGELRAVGPEDEDRAGPEAPKEARRRR